MVKSNEQRQRKDPKQCITNMKTAGRFKLNKGNEISIVNEIVGEVEWVLESCIQTRHLNPCIGGGDEVWTDEWQCDEGGVTRGKLHSSLCFISLCPRPLPSPLCSKVFLLKLPEKTSSLLLTLSLILAVLQANSACQIKHTAGLHNTATLSPHS